MLHQHTLYSIDMCVRLQCTYNIVNLSEVKSIVEPRGGASGNKTGVMDRWASNCRICLELNSREQFVDDVVVVEDEETWCSSRNVYT